MTTFRKIVIAALTFGAAASGQSLADTVPLDGPEAWEPTAGDVIAFDVLRQGSKFGSHIVRFNEGSDGALEVVVDVDLKAGLGPITLFKYQLDATETWVDGQLVELEGRVNDDGTRERVRATRGEEGLIIAGDGFEGIVSPEVLPASHWNADQTRAAQLLSAENGELIDVAVLPLGREVIEAGGAEIEANKYLMDSDIDVTLWYGDDGRWLKLAFEARGQAIEYVLRDLY
ncbi:MAG: DUF6134 family protein [Pseudomonadota bacterium]